MFLIRSAFWLGTVVMLLPPSADGERPAPRVSLYNAVAAARTLVADLGAICERNPRACETSGQALVHVGRKLDTGVDIVSAGLAGGEAADDDSMPGEERGTLRPEDLAPVWAAPET